MLYNKGLNGKNVSSQTEKVFLQKRSKTESLHKGRWKLQKQGEMTNDQAFVVDDRCVWVLQKRQEEQ